MFGHQRAHYDRILTGWLLGAIVPLIIFGITYEVKYSEMELSVYLRDLWHMKLFLKIISLCVFPNLGFFFIFYKLKYDMAARGVIMATFMYTFLVLIAKMV